MRWQWRLGLVAVTAVALVGGAAPHGSLPAVQRASSEVLQVVESPWSGPLRCMDATCGKGGSPAMPAGTAGVAGAAVLTALALVATAASTVRRRHRRASVLPAGCPDSPYHPPRSS